MHTWSDEVGEMRMIISVWNQKTILTIFKTAKCAYAVADRSFGNDFGIFGEPASEGGKPVVPNFMSHTEE